MENRFSANTTEPFNTLWHKMYNRGLAFELIVIPSQRLLRSFLHNSLSCSFPVSLSIIKHNIDKESIKLITAEPVSYPGMQVFTQAPNNQYTNLSNLDNKHIAGSFGFDPLIVLNNSKVASFTRVENNETLLKILYKQRVDAILTFTPDIFIAANKENLPTPYATGIWVLKPRGISLVCHDTAANRQLIKKFNQQLRQMKKSGELRDILGPYVLLEKPQ